MLTITPLKIGLTALSTSLLFCAALAQTPATPSPKPSLSVTVTSPVQERLVQTLPINGSLVAWQEAIIGAEANGLKIVQVHANVGDRVNKGFVLANLQTDTLQAEMAQAKANLAEANAAAQEAKAQAQRARSLQQQGFYSAAQLSQALATEVSAQARVQSAEALIQLQTVRLNQAQVIAPDAGIVSARSATVGSVVGAGTELFRLIRQGRLEWRGEITPSDIASIRTGSLVKITAASGQMLQGKVRTVAPSIEATSRKALVYVDVLGSSGSARAGMFAKGEIETGRIQTITVPQTAVVARDGFSYVYIVGNDLKVSQQKVEIGRVIGDRMEVTSGLTLAVRIVVSGGAFLNHGDTVRIVQSTTSAPSAAASSAASSAATKNASSKATSKSTPSATPAAK